MSTMKLLVVAALLCVVASLAMGMLSLGRGGHTSERSSAQFMTLRVVFQAAAVALMLLALLMS